MEIFNSEQRKKTPSKPGVYLFINIDNEIIYIGKAANLRDRISYYFHRNISNSPKTEYMIKKINSFEFIVTANETEALLLENNLIKKYQPRYNINLKDDKSYPYIKLTAKDKYPTVFVTRNKIDDGSIYYGPYTNAGAAKYIVQMMRKHLRVRSCTVPLSRIKRPCLMYHIHRCPGPCRVGEVDEKKYAEIIEDVRMLLERKNEPLIERLCHKMKTAADEMEYELAASYRDFIRYLEETTSKQRISGSGSNYEDIIGYHFGNENIVAQLFHIRKDMIVGRKEFIFPRSSDIEPGEFLRSLISQYYFDSFDIPPFIVTPVPVEDSEQIEKILSAKRDSACHLVQSQRGRRGRLIELAMENARLSNETFHSKDKTETALIELQNILALSSLPIKIEGFDISTLQGTNTVASMVSFKSGLQEKSGYRKYNIKTVRGIDDYASLREVVYRRYRRLISEDKEMPDFILIDGGPGQLSAALEALESLGIFDQSIASIAKSEELIYLPGKSKPIRLPGNSPALNLIQQVRDEAHRFAITAQRKKRTKKGLTSLLDDIPGIGPAYRKKLLESFGSLEKIKEAGIKELAEVIGNKRAESLKKYFNKK